MSMITGCKRMCFVFFFMALAVFPAVAQDSTFKTTPASLKYQKSQKYQKRWGKHYRKEWETPITHKVAMLDTLAGGVVPYQQGGGRQTKTLRLHDKNKREYVLRSIDKSFGGALPEIAQGTFVEDLIDDQASIGHPYAAIVIKPMAEAAGILHTNPTIYYIPKQPALGKFNESHGDELYLFEQRPDENWETAANFANSENIVGTEKLHEKLLEDNDNTVHQELFVRSRLFDMFIGDWGRHEDQWRWAKTEEGKKNIYLPVPRDRDQAFTLFDGKWLNVVLSVVAGHLQSFEGDIEDVKDYNFPARYLDRLLTTDVDLHDWELIAADLQKRLTDDVITAAIKRMPADIYAISGETITRKLISRRSHLLKYAREYFLHLNREVDVKGSEKHERFVIDGQGDSTIVRIYKTNKDEEIKDLLFDRTFKSSQTREIRLYGIDGEDRFVVSGHNRIPLKLIGGPGRDSFMVNPTGNSVAVKIYDNSKNNFKTSGNVKRKLSSDTSVHSYSYTNFKESKSSFLPVAFYSFEDRIYVGALYKVEKQAWRKKPYHSFHKLSPKFSISQGMPSITYENHYTSVIGKWGIETYINYDFMLWTNFYGIGNQSEMPDATRDYNRVRSREFTGKIGLSRILNNRHKISLFPFFRSTDIISDTDRFISKSMDPLSIPGFYSTKNYAGVEGAYIYQNINDSILPTKGFVFNTFAGFSQGVNEQKLSFTRYGLEVNGYIPFTRKTGMHLRSGGASLSGDPEFFQLNRIGSTDNLRGYERDRFYGKTTQYNQVELRWISDVRSYYYNGKFGLFGFYDVGRVWLNDDDTDNWHSGYGAGIIVSPFNKISATLAYGISKDGGNLHVDLIRALGK